MKTPEQLLKELCADFENEKRQTSFKSYMDATPPSTGLIEGDGWQSLSYLAVRLFKGQVNRYEAWLLRADYKRKPPDAPIDILMKGTRVEDVRDMVMEELLTDKRLLPVGLMSKPPGPQVSEGKLFG